TTARYELRASPSMPQRKRRRTSSRTEGFFVFFFSSRRRHTRFACDWSSDVCSSDLGRVTKKDVQDFAAKAKAAPAPAPQAAPAGPGQGDEVVQLTRVRRLIAENMTRSKQTIPHAWQTQEVDMSGVVASRTANKGGFQKQEGFSLTYLPYVMAAAISALREHPE